MSVNLKIAAIAQPITIVFAGTILDIQEGTSINALTMTVITLQFNPLLIKCISKTNIQMYPMLMD